MTRDRYQYSAFSAPTEAPSSAAATEFPTCRLEKICRRNGSVRWRFLADGYAATMSSRQLLSPTEFWRRVFIATHGAVFIDHEPDEHRTFVQSLLADVDEVAA
jgi:hypothetical protein